MFNFWIKHSKFKTNLKEVLGVEVEGTAIFKVYSKLKLLNELLKKQNSADFSDLQLRVKQARTILLLSCQAIDGT